LLPIFQILFFLGFSAAMLGVSGFETSANYVEQQKPGVFRLTLRNMWVAVARGKIALRAMQTGETIHNEPLEVSSTRVADAILTADELGRSRQKSRKGTGRKTVLCSRATGCRTQAGHKPGDKRYRHGHRPLLWRIVPISPTAKTS
jgi:hypothetical protein